MAEVRIAVMRPVRYSDWQARIGGLLYRPLAGQQPNAFHRLMQRLILGIKWERVNP